jgi:uncharacterized protein (DUF58 family)
MDARINKLLTPELLSSLDGLELISRIIVEGFMSGSNKSKSVGFGQEFSQYRSYEPGDDLRQLDWKMYARSERYFIKQAEIETNITVKLMLDGSNSMAYAEHSVSKFDYAKVLIAALGYLARKQGDAIGLSIINQQQLVNVIPRFEQHHFMRFLHFLANAKPDSVWPKGTDIEHLFDHHGKEMIIFISDLYDEQNDILSFISRLKTKRNEVIVFHLLGEQETNLGMQGTFTFRDLETGEVHKVNTEAVRSKYVDQLSSWIQLTKNQFLEKGIHYYKVTMNEDMNEVLRNFINARKLML